MYGVSPLFIGAALSAHTHAGITHQPVSAAIANALQVLME